MASLCRARVLFSRKERKQQRSSFREVHRAFAESEPPEETISFRTKSFRLTSWAKIKQMEAIRDCLQVGQTHRQPRLSPSHTLLRPPHQK